MTHKKQIKQTAKMETAQLSRIVKGVRLGITNRQELKRFSQLPFKELLELRKAGDSDRAIAEAFGVSEGDVKRRFADTMKGFRDAAAPSRYSLAI